MLTAIAIALHVLAAVIWVGGMFFAYVALRPAAAVTLEPPLRLTLWVNTFKRFFPWVYVCIIFLLATGFWLISQSGGMAQVGKHIHTMMTLGIIMVLLFLHVYFAPYKRLKNAVTVEDWAKGGKAIAQIRILIGVNLTIGLVLISVATIGSN